MANAGGNDGNVLGCGQSYVTPVELWWYFSIIQRILLKSTIQMIVVANGDDSFSRCI